MPKRPAPTSLRSPPPPAYSSTEVEVPSTEVDSRCDPDADSQIGEGDEETDVVTGLDGRPVRGESTSPAVIDDFCSATHKLPCNDSLLNGRLQRIRGLWAGDVVAGEYAKGR